MKSRPYLIFNLHNLAYAIAADRVREIFLLPELTPIIDAPPDIIGLLDLHSQIVPIMHLDLRLGRTFESCNLNDSVIVIESQGLQVGVVVHQVKTVDEIDFQYVRDDLSYGREDRDINTAFVTGTIILDDETIPLLNADRLIRHSEEVAAIIENDDSETAIDEKVAAKKIGDFYELYFPQASTLEKLTLAQRAQNLKVNAEESESSELKPIAIVSLGNEYFGLDLDIVREFIKIDRVTVIPCCPHRIIGNMNLRGEILTLVDIRQTLSIKAENNCPAKAVVIDVDDVVAGIAVDEVLDVLYYHPEEMKPVPVGIDRSLAEYLQNTASYEDRLLGIIDLTKMFEKNVLAVDLAA